MPGVANTDPERDNAVVWQSRTAAPRLLGRPAPVHVIAELVDVNDRGQAAGMSGTFTNTGFNARRAADLAGRLDVAEAAPDPGRVTEEPRWSSPTLNDINNRGDIVGNVYGFAAKDYVSCAASIRSSGRAPSGADAGPLSCRIGASDTLGFWLRRQAVDVVLAFGFVGELHEVLPAAALALITARWPCQVRSRDGWGERAATGLLVSGGLEVSGDCAREKQDREHTDDRDTRDKDGVLAERLPALLPLIIAPHDLSVFPFPASGKRAEARGNASPSRRVDTYCHARRSAVTEGTTLTTWRRRWRSASSPAEG